MTDDRIKEIAHRKAWRYKHSTNPHHSDTYTFNDRCLIDFTRAVIEAECQKVPENEQLQRIHQWCEAYPVDIFIEPDWEEVKEKLGSTLLTQVSAANMRHVVEGIKKLAAAPKPAEPVAFYIYKETAPRLGIPSMMADALPWVYDQDPSSGFSARLKVYLAPPDQSAEVERLRANEERATTAIISAAMRERDYLERIAELEQQRNRLVTALQAETGKLGACEKQRDELVVALESVKRGVTPEVRAALASVKEKV